MDRPDVDQHLISRAEGILRREKSCFIMLCVMLLVDLGVITYAYLSPLHSIIGVIIFGIVGILIIINMFRSRRITRYWKGMISNIQADGAATFQPPEF